jgi:hypothetical protein
LNLKYYWQAKIGSHKHFCVAIPRSCGSTKAVGKDIFEPLSSEERLNLLSVPLRSMRLNWFHLGLEALKEKEKVLKG